MTSSMNISSLENTLRQELRSKELTEVSEDFYKDVRKYIGELKEKIESETLKKNYRNISKVSNELEKAEEDLKKIVEIRASKILKARAENFKAAIEGRMTLEEKIFYDSVSQLLKDHIESLITGKIIISEKEKVSEKREVEEREGEGSYSVANNFRVVYINKDTPTLVIDGKNIKLKKEDILTIPEKYAKILEAQGVAKIIK